MRVATHEEKAVKEPVRKVPTPHDVKPEKLTLDLLRSLGIHDQRLARELIRTGIRPNTLRLLHLIPTVEVAWSDGNMSEEERSTILDIASKRGIHPGSEAYFRLEHWLDEEPDREVFHNGLEAVIATLKYRSPIEAEALSRELLQRCELVAKASASMFGLGPRLSAREQKALEKLQGKLQRHVRIIW